MLTRITNSLFYIWLLSMPFYLFSVVGTLSIDNILGPVVLLFGLAKYFNQLNFVSNQRHKTIFGVIVLFSFYGAGLTISVMSDSTYVSIVLYELLKQSIYLFIPIIVISRMNELRVVFKLLIVNATVGCVSVFLVALGLLELSVTRFSPTRLNISDLPKSIGLFANYGDLAILSGFAIVAIIVHPLSTKNRLLNISLTLCVFMIVLMGYLGAQSRNIFLTVIAGLLTYLYFSFTLKKNTLLSLTGMSIMVSLGVFLTGIIVFSEVDIISSLAGWGGAQAHVTANDRLLQYEYAWDLFLTAPIFGLGIKIIDSGVHIHNIWLNLMAMGGFVSTISVAMLFLYIILKCIKSKVNYKYLCLSLSLLMTIFIASEFYGSLSYIFFLFMGLSVTIPSVYESK